MGHRGGSPGRTLSMVVPAWNEDQGIDQVIDACTSALDGAVTRGLLEGGEVVVVDDCSTDATAARVAQRAAGDERVVLVRHGENRGLGAAITSGIAAARGTLVLYTDADLPVDMAATVPALELLDTTGADMVAGQRRVRAGDGARRRAYTLGYDLLVRASLGVGVRDVNFAFKLFRRADVAALGLRSQGSFIDAEMVARLLRTGGTVAPLEVAYLPRRWGTSTLGGLRAIRSILRELVAQAPEIRRLSTGVAPATAPFAPGTGSRT